MGEKWVLIKFWENTLIKFWEWRLMFPHPSSDFLHSCTHIVLGGKGTVFVVVVVVVLIEWIAKQGDIRERVRGRLHCRPAGPHTWFQSWGHPVASESSGTQVSQLSLVQSVSTVSQPGWWLNMWTRWNTHTTWNCWPFSLQFQEHFMKFEDHFWPEAPVHFWT